MSYQKVEKSMRLSKSNRKYKNDGTVEEKEGKLRTSFKNLVGGSPYSENVLTTQGMKTEGSKYCCSSKKLNGNNYNEEL